MLLWHWGRRGGGPRYTLELARALVNRPGVSLHLSLSRQSELFSETDGLGLPSVHVDTYTGLPSFALRSALLPVLGRRVTSYIREHQIDVVYSTMDFLWGSVLAPAISRSQSSYLLAVHDAERHPGENGWSRRWLLRRDISCADGAITMTEAVRARLLDIYSFPAEHPGTELEIWTSGDIEQYRELLERTEGVRLEHGWIHEERIPSIFAQTDLCILPYREASQSAVIATALAAGMPVVATPIDGLVEQIAGGAAGRVATDFGPVAFARAVCDLLGNPKAYARASLRALAVSENELSWDSIAGTIENAARSLRALGPRRNR